MRNGRAITGTLLPSTVLMCTGCVAIVEVALIATGRPTTPGLLVGFLFAGTLAKSRWMRGRTEGPEGHGPAASRHTV